MRVCQKCSSLYPIGTRFCGIDGEPLVAFRDDPLLGKVVGRYRISSLMGRGGCGSVYKAVHTELNSEFAVKVLFGNLGGDARYVERFRREAQVVSKIRSPWVVSVVDFGTSDAGLTYLVMEYCDGVGLDQIIAKDRQLAPARAARFASQIAAALSVAHKAGLVHRDVKPANVMVQTQDGKEFAKLLDFGIVRAPEMDRDEKLTQEGMVMGTPPYMSPEQATGSEVTAAADLYSLGVVLYQMLSGNKPFTGTALEIFDKHRNEPPPPLPVSGPVAELCLKLLAKRPSDRPESASWVHQQAKRIEHELRRASGDPSELSFEPGALGPDPSDPRLRPAEPAPTIATPAPGTPSAAAMMAAPLTASGMPAVVTAEQAPFAAPAARSPALLALTVGLGIVTAGLGGYLVVSRSSALGATPTSQPLPPPSGAALAKELDLVLEARGLLPADLDALVETRAANAQRRAEEAAPGGASSATMTRLLELARTAAIPAELLSARLDALDGALAGAAAKLPEKDAEALKTEYLDLYKQLQMASTSPEREVMAKAILRFERTLRAR